MKPTPKDYYDYEALASSHDWLYFGEFLNARERVEKELCRMRFQKRAAEHRKKLRQTDGNEIIG